MCIFTSSNSKENIFVPMFVIQSSFGLDFSHQTMIKTKLEKYFLQKKSD